jgi:H+/Cl- antiporter ClcA
MARTKPTGENVMGKAARNEILKLQAAFFNNIAVGVMIGGVLLPFVILLFIKNQGVFQFDQETYFAIGGMVASFAGALYTHVYAVRFLRGIED